MPNFTDEYEVTVDAKGRFLLPSGFRKQLAEGAEGKFMMNRGFEACIALYTMDVWEKLSRKINKLNAFDPKVREFKRLFLNGATVVETDSAGRILIPQHLMGYAGIKKDAVFSSMGNNMELWDKDTHSRYIAEHKDGYSDLAAEVAGDMSDAFDDE